MHMAPIVAILIGAHLVYYRYFLRQSPTCWQTSFLVLAIAIGLYCLPHDLILPKFGGIPFLIGGQILNAISMIMLMALTVVQYFLLRWIEKLAWLKALFFISGYWIFQVLGVVVYFSVRIFLER